MKLPNREAAARWYAEHLGFEPVERFEFWANGFAGGPLQISADGGQTMLALFEAGEGHPMIPQKTGVAFSLGADDFMAFARSLPGDIDNPSGRPLQIGDIVDFDLCPFQRPMPSGVTMASTSQKRGYVNSRGRVAAGPSKGLYSAARRPGSAR